MGAHNSVERGSSQLGGAWWKAKRRAAQEAKAKARARRELGGGAKAGAFVSAGGALANLGFKCTPTVSVK